MKSTLKGGALFVAHFVLETISFIHRVGLTCSCEQLTQYEAKLTIIVIHASMAEVQ